MSQEIDTKVFSNFPYEEKINVLIERPEAVGLPEEAAYVAQYMAQYRPLLPPQKHFDNETSVDIQDTMQSICIIDTKVVSKIMKLLGYRLHIQGISQPEWSMKHVDSI